MLRRRFRALLALGGCICATPLGSCTNRPSASSVGDTDPGPPTETESETGTDAGTSSSTGGEASGSSTGDEPSGGGETLRLVYSSEAGVFARDVIDGEVQDPVTLLRGTWRLSAEQLDVLPAISDDAIVLIDTKLTQPQVRASIPAPVSDAFVFLHAATSTNRGSRWLFSSLVSPQQPAQMHVVDVDESGPSEARRVDEGLVMTLPQASFVRGGSHVLFEGASGFWMASATGDPRPVAIPLAEPEEAWERPWFGPVLAGADGERSILVYMQGTSSEPRSSSSVYAVDLERPELSSQEIGRLEQAQWSDSSTAVAHPYGGGFVVVQGAANGPVDLAWIAFEDGEAMAPVQLSTGEIAGKVAREPQYVPIRPLWSPDGSRLLFEVHDERPRQVTVAWTDGVPSTPVQVSEDASIEDAAFAQAVDFLYFRQRTVEPSKLFRAAFGVDGFDTSQVVLDVPFSRFAVADDGASFVYGSPFVIDDEVPRDWMMWFVSVDDTGPASPRLLASCDGGGTARLSPAGTFILCSDSSSSTNDQVHRLVDTRTGAAYELTRGSRYIHMESLP